MKKDFKEMRASATIARYRYYRNIREAVYQWLMASPLKNVAKSALQSNIRKRMEKKRLAKQWEKYGGRHDPLLDADKQQTIKSYAQRFRLHSMVETGTYRGEMVNATRDIFQKIFSIELDQDLFQKAADRFAHDQHITILQGDSGKVLPAVLKQIHEPALFWLDGHYSGGPTALGDLSTPILEEVKHVLRHPIKGHVMLIDDARAFIGKGDYPMLDGLRQYIESLEPGLIFIVENDIIRVYRDIDNS